MLWLLCLAFFLTGHSLFYVIISLAKVVKFANKRLLNRYVGLDSDSIPFDKIVEGLLKIVSIDNEFLTVNQGAIWAFGPYCPTILCPRLVEKATPHS
jgi:hypothetical protein